MQFSLHRFERNKFDIGALDLIHPQEICSIRTGEGNKHKMQGPFISWNRLALICLLQISLRVIVSFFRILVTIKIVPFLVEYPDSQFPKRI